MARTKQKLINYHTGSASAMPNIQDVSFGEIVVRHNAGKPEILIKVSSGTTGENYGEYFVPFIASDKIMQEIRAAATALEGTIGTVSAGVVTLSGSVLSNYATSADTVAAINAAKDAAISSGGTYTDSQIQMLSGITSAYVANELTAVTNNITSLGQRVGALETFSGNVVDNYATKAYSDSGDSYVQEVLIGTSEDTKDADTIWGAKNYTDDRIGYLSGITSAYVESMLTGTTGDVQRLQQEVGALSGSLSAFSATVESNYATKEYADAESAAAVTTVVGTSEDASTANTVYGAKKYTDEKVNTLSGNVVTYVDGKVTTINQDITSAFTGINNLETAVSGMSGNVVDYIDERLVTVYKYKGSVADYEALTAVSPKENGDVYNVVAENGTPGEAGYTPAGTNYAWVADSGETGGGHWDPLGGSVDLSAYALDSDLDTVEGKVTTLESATGTLNTNLTNLSGAVSAFSASVVDNYSTSADTLAAKNEAVTSAYTASTAYTDEQIQMLSGVTSAYVETKLSTISQKVTDLETNSATHTEVANASAATFESAYTAAVASAKSYTDSRETAIIGGASSDYNTLKKAEDKIKELSGGTIGRFETNEATIQGLVTSATDWNNLVAGSVTDARFGAVADDAEGKKGGQGSGATVDSNAKMIKDGGDIVLDLSGLIIDCGDFDDE